MVEGDGGYVVVEDVGLDDAVKESAADEAKLAVDGCSGAAGVGPSGSVVVGKRGVGVLKVRDGNYRVLAFGRLEDEEKTYRASG